MRTPPALTEPGGVLLFQGTRVIAECLKDPVSVAPRPANENCDQIRPDRTGPGGTKSAVGRFFPKGDSIMPVWMDILLNVIGYAGFVGMATLSHSADETTRSDAERVS
ncbi:MAG: hypothetical protein U1E61_18170 [Bradyrhizobium sp.]